MSDRPITGKPFRARKPRSRRAPLRQRNRRQTHLARRRDNQPAVTPELALHALMTDGDLYRVGRQHYLVAPVDRAMLDMLIEASGATEDSECNGDLESSIGTNDDLEGDGLDDGPYGMPRGHECALGWADEGSQQHLSCSADESEPELGWANTGPQLQLSEGYSGGNLREGDDNCDAEDDDPGGDPLDAGESDGNCDDEPEGSADLFRFSTGGPLDLKPSRLLGGRR